MLKSLVVAFLMLGVCILLPLYSFAQEAGRSTVTLNSGEVVEGVITEAVPDKYIKIMLADGTERTINTSDIKEMKTDIAEWQKRPSEKVLFSAIFGFHTSFDVASDMDYLFIEPRVIVGGKTKGIHFGAGVSFLHGKARGGYEVTDVFALGNFGKESMNFLPVFFNVHGDLGKKRVKPSFDFSAGYPVSLNGKDLIFTNGIADDYNEYYSHIRPSIYLQLAPGVSIKVGGVLVNVALQYQMLRIRNLVELTNFYNGTKTFTDELYTESFFIHSVGFSVNLIY